VYGNVYINELGRNRSYFLIVIEEVACYHLYNASEQAWKSLARLVISNLPAAFARFSPHLCTNTVISHDSLSLFHLSSICSCSTLTYLFLFPLSFLVNFCYISFYTAATTLFLNFFYVVFSRRCTFKKKIFNAYLSRLLKNWNWYILGIFWIYLVFQYHVSYCCKFILQESFLRSLCCE